MVTLTDLALKKRKVSELQDIEVQGVSAEGIVFLLNDVPELRQVFVGRELGGDMMKELLGQSPLVLAHIVAAGIGKAGNGEEIKAALNLPAGSTALLVSAIVECTFPQGLNRFIEGLTKLMEGAGVSVGEPIKGADTKSPASSKESLVEVG